MDTPERDAITEERNGDRGRFVLHEQGGDSALTFVVHAGRMVIDHTYTPPAMRGRGVRAAGKSCRNIRM